MARYLGSIQGARGPVTRLGNGNSGLYVKANGWNFGVSVELRPGVSRKDDVAVIHLTGGSNGGKCILLAEISEAEFKDLQGIEINKQLPINRT